MRKREYPVGPGPEAVSPGAGPSTSIETLESEEVALQVNLGSDVVRK